MEMTDCNYPDCGCDWDAICGKEVLRRMAEPEERYPWLGKFAVAGIITCLVAFAVVWLAFVSKLATG